MADWTASNYIKRSAKALTRKGAEKVLRKVPARKGVPGKVWKKVLRVPSPVLRRVPSPVLPLQKRAAGRALSSAPLFGPALSEALF